MQAAARQALAEISRGVSIGAVLWAGSSTCPPLHLKCPDCFCGAGGGTGPVRDDTGGWSALALVICFLLGAGCGCFLALLVLVRHVLPRVPRAAIAGNGRLVRAGESGRRAPTPGWSNNL